MLIKTARLDGAGLNLFGYLNGFQMLSSSGMKYSRG